MVIGLWLINMLVDIINFFIFDLNCLLYVFDVVKVKGDLVVWFVVVGESLLVLDGKIYVFIFGMMVILDENGFESIVGIMGGEVLGCDEVMVDVFLESVFWNFIVIVMIGCVLKINFDVCYCFECGVDLIFIQVGLELVMQMIFDLCGGEVFEVVIVGVVFDIICSYMLQFVWIFSFVGMDIFEVD